MDSAEIELSFWRLVDRANDFDTEASRIKDRGELVDANRLVEPTYLEICKLFVDHAAMRKSFVQWFSDLALQKRKSPWMLVPFCMRVLRIPEIKDALDREMNERVFGTAKYAQMMSYCSSVMHAYQDHVWENATAFDSFAHELEAQD